MIIFYHLFLFFYSAGIRVASLWNKKAKLWVNGRKSFFAKANELVKPKNSTRIWMHCASLGEFEQGRPVLKELKAIYPDVSLIITFFSPSGYEIVTKNNDFRYIYYLPMDSPENAKKLVATFQPDLVLWVKYEYWFYYLKELKARKVPVILISGIFRKSHPFFKWYGKFWINMLPVFSHFFVQNNDSYELLQELIPEKKITVSGDTRCDRVINIASNFTDIPGIKEFCGEHTVIVAGSTWEDDEAEWMHFAKQHPEIKFIIAPHEIDAENIADVKKEFAGSITYSDWINQGVGDQFIKSAGANCLIIDNIGILSRLYKYATLTYVGGGFGYDGLHNVLEAAVYGKPVIFGPEYEKNFEAEELIDCRGGISIASAIELEKVLQGLLADKNEIAARGAAAADYVFKNAGASKKIADYIIMGNYLQASVPR